MSWRRPCHGLRVGAGRVHRAPVCFACWPGGPVVPPPCLKCGSTDHYFTNGLCTRCHQFGRPPTRLLHRLLRLGRHPHQLALDRCDGCAARQETPARHLPQLRPENLPLAHDGGCRLCRKQRTPRPRPPTRPTPTSSRPTGTEAVVLRRHVHPQRTTHPGEEAAPATAGNARRRAPGPTAKSRCSRACSRGPAICASCEPSASPNHPTRASPTHCVASSRTPPAMAGPKATPARPGAPCASCSPSKRHPEPTSAPAMSRSWARSATRSRPSGRSSPRPACSTTTENQRSSPGSVPGRRSSRRPARRARRLVRRHAQRQLDPTAAAPRKDATTTSQLRAALPAVRHWAATLDSLARSPATRSKPSCPPPVGSDRCCCSRCGRSSACSKLASSCSPTRPPTCTPASPTHRSRPDRPRQAPRRISARTTPPAPRSLRCWPSTPSA